MKKRRIWILRKTIQKQRRLLGNPAETNEYLKLELPGALETPDS